MRRKLFIGALTLGLFLAGLGAASFPALAELRTITIELVGGQTIVTTVDVPPNTPLEQIKLPQFSAPIASIKEGPRPAKPAEGSDPSDPNAGQPSPGGDEKTKKPKRKRGSRNDADKPDRKGGDKRRKKRGRDRSKQNDGGHSDTPTSRDPLSLDLPGPAPIGVPNFVINKFRIPPFLLPLYQAAGVQYGIRWEVLAAINEIETDYGRNLNVSSAGAVGWMQFLPSTWRTYGVDANRDGERDPYNPVDAIFAAARYLKAAGAGKSLRRAIFAYNHADWYVDSVLMRARLIAGLPADLVGSLTGLTQGHFPVHATARYADDLRARDVRRLGRKVRRAHNAARIVDADADRRSIDIYSRRGAPVIAVNDGVVKKIGRNDRLGRYVVLQDVYGNRYTYAHLGSLSKRYPVPKRSARAGSGQDEFLAAREPELPKPSGPASAGSQERARDGSGKSAYRRAPSASPAPLKKERLFAHPSRAKNKRLAEASGQLNRALLGRAGFEVFQVYFSRVFRLGPEDVNLKQLKKGSKVIAGTVLGRIGKLERGPGSKLAPHVNFSIRPSGRGAPRIDPKPILDGWRLLEATAIYRAAGRNPFLGPGAERPAIGQILLMSKEALARRVLADPRVDVYSCGRSDVRSGQIDRRVLATLEFLAASGLRPSVTSLKCGHGYYTKSGSVSHHSSGNAVDIAEVNGVPILGHQGSGSVTELTVRRLMTLQGAMQPAQIISLLDMGGPTLAMGDHADHIHVGFRPLYGPNARLGKQARRILSSNQWDRFVDRLTGIRNPVVRTRPSRYSIKVRRRGSHGRRGSRRASRAHPGE